MSEPIVEWVAIGSGDPADHRHEDLIDAKHDHYFDILTLQRKVRRLEMWLVTIHLAVALLGIVAIGLVMR